MQQKHPDKAHRKKHTLWQTHSVWGVWLKYKEVNGASGETNQGGATDHSGGKPIQAGSVWMICA